MEKTLKKQKQDNPAEEIIEEVKNKIEEETGKSWKYITEPKHIKVLKILIILIALVIVGYLIYANFIVSQEFTYFYDIGSPQDVKKPYLSPLVRVSDVIQEDDVNYRNITSGLVYFNVPITKGVETVKIEARFKNNFPENAKMSIGAKDQEVWHYTYNSVYNSVLDNLNDFENINNVYRINPNLRLLNQEQLKEAENIIIATDKNFQLIPNKISEYKKQETIINASLRGRHIFYIYASGDLSLEVKKQDINWYEDSDELEISLYDSDNNLIANTTIPDDGIVDVKKGNAIIQTGNLKANSLKDGVYKLEFSDFDGLIREIKINTNKIVSNKLFLADNSLYNGIETKQSKIYTEAIRNLSIRFNTWHKEGFQDIFIDNKIFKIIQKENKTTYNIKIGRYYIRSEKNDIIISNPGYFAFSEENYFEPFKQRIIPLENDIDWIKNNADYVITDYNAPLEDNNWLIGKTTFNINWDNLVVKDNQLSLLFNTPHLSNELSQNQTIPIDWISIKVHKPGMIEKIKNGESVWQAFKELI